MTLENQALHLQITELEAQLAEARAEVERAGRDYDELIAQQSKFGELFQQANNGQPLTIDQIRKILVDSVISTDAEVNAIKAERDRLREALVRVLVLIESAGSAYEAVGSIRYAVQVALSPNDPRTHREGDGVYEGRVTVTDDDGEANHA